jgi:hypothetical protein
MQGKPIPGCFQDLLEAYGDPPEDTTMDEEKEDERFYS